MSITSASASRRGPAGPGWFCLSLDFELAWGVHGTRGWKRYCRRMDQAAGVIDSIMSLLEGARVSATWATVTAIAADSPDAARAAGAANPATLDAAALGPERWWQGRDLLNRILGSTVKQDVGCHSASHLVFDERTSTLGQAKSELDACRTLATELGISPVSWVFPCNLEGYHSQVRDAGFRVFRGEPTTRRGIAGRAMRLAEQAASSRPRVARPVRHASGLWNVPASMFLMPLRGVRGIGGAAARLRRVRLGLDAAAANGAVFHLWSHPHNFMADSDRMLGLLSDVLGLVQEHAEREGTRLGSMADIAAAAGAGESR